MLLKLFSSSTSVLNWSIVGSLSLHAGLVLVCLALNFPLAQSFENDNSPSKGVQMPKGILFLDNFEPAQSPGGDQVEKKGFRGGKAQRNDGMHFGKRSQDTNRKWLLLATRGGNPEIRNGDDLSVLNGNVASQRPILTSEELANQLRDDPRLAKAVVDAWIDTNNDGVITGTEILGRK